MVNRQALKDYLESIDRFVCIEHSVIVFEKWHEKDIWYEVHSENHNSFKTTDIDKAIIYYCYLMGER